MTPERLNTIMSDCCFACFHRAAELMFENYKVPALFLAKNAVCLCHDQFLLQLFCYFLIVDCAIRCSHLLRLDELHLWWLTGDHLLRFIPLSRYFFSYETIAPFAHVRLVNSRMNASSFAVCFHWFFLLFI